MKEVLYLDVYFLLNFAMDLVSLSTASLILSEKTTLRRLIFSSAFGAGFSLFLVFVSASDAATLFWGVAAFFVMVRIAFGKKNFRRTAKFALFSFLTALFLGGAAEWITYYIFLFGGSARIGISVFLIVVLLSFGVFSLWGKCLHRKLETAVVSLSISFCGKNEHFFGLVDSGLLLKDPESGRPVLLLKAAFADSLLPKDFLSHLKTGQLSSGEALFSVPIKTASGKGTMYAFLPDRVSIVKSKKGKMKADSVEMLVALDFTEGGYGGCPCLVPLSVL